MKSILLVRLSAMGDLVHAVGAVAALHEAVPDARLTFVTQAPFAPLLRGLPGLSRVVAFRRDGGLGAVRELRAALRADRFDVALDLQGNWKSAATTWLSGARLRLGAAGAARQEALSRWWLHRAVPIGGAPHPARVAWELVRQIAPDAPFRLPRLEAAGDELAAERAALASVGIDATQPFRVVVVTDPHDPRALRPAVVARLLREPGPPWLQVFGPAESHLAAAPGAALRHGRGEVRRLIALGALVAATGGQVVGPDQGATHVLAAAGADCLVAFGAQDPRRTAPPAARAIVHPAPPACMPCRSRSCRHPQGPVCMDFAPASGRAVPVGLPSPDRESAPP